MKKKDVFLLSRLRNNARVPLTALSRQTGLPVSTIHDRLCKYSRRLVPRYTALLSFADLGFSTTAHIMLKVEKEKKNDLVEHLSKCDAVNTLFRVNNRWDLICEGVFKDMYSLEEFVESLERNYGVIDKEIHYVLSEVKREAFLSDPATAGFLTTNFKY